MQKNILVILFFLCCIGTPAQYSARKDTILMGSTFSFTCYHATQKFADKCILEGIQEVSRIENEISDWLPNTPISRLNTQAGHAAVPVSNEVFDLLQRSVHYSALSGGLFDITYAGMERIWKYDGSMTRLPSEAEVAKARKYVGIRLLVLDSVKKTAALSEKGAKISFGSIGKAYAAEKAARRMQQNGARAVLVNASGDIFALGAPPRKKYWQVGLQDPKNAAKVTQKIKIREGAVVTSGDYEKYIWLKGQRYGHIINPLTGYPGTEITSVTVAGPNAETANFLSTTLMLASENKAVELAQKFPLYSIWVYPTTGKLRRYNH